MRVSLVVVLISLGTVGMAGELGARLNWDGQWAGVAWASWSGELGGVSFTLREEVDILALSHRILSGRVRASGGWWESSLSGKLLGTGRLDVSGSWELSQGWESRSFEAEGKVGLRASWAGVTSEGVISYRGWGELEVKLPPGWGELRLESPLPVANPRWQLAAGVRGPGWFSWRASGEKAGLGQLSLELGGGEGALTASSFFTLLPSPGGGGSVRLGLGLWALKLGLNARPGSWRYTAVLFWEGEELSGKLTLRFSRAGWLGASAEVTWEW